MADDLTETAIFQELRATPIERDMLGEKREMQSTFDSVLGRLGSRAVAPRDGESSAHYLATLATQVADYGPEERRNIDRLSLPPQALAEIARQDLRYAKAEIEMPNHSLRPDELREVIKTDRAGHQISEFFSKCGPSIWMSAFAGDTVRVVSGGSNGIGTETRSAWHSFRSDSIPEVREIARIEAHHQSPEYLIAKAYRDVGKDPPAMAELMRAKR